VGEVERSLRRGNIWGERVARERMRERMKKRQAEKEEREDEGGTGKETKIKAERMIQGERERNVRVRKGGYAPANLSQGDSERGGEKKAEREKERESKLSSLILLVFVCVCVCVCIWKDQRKWLKRLKGASMLSLPSLSLFSLVLSLCSLSWTFLLFGVERPFPVSREFGQANFC